MTGSGRYALAWLALLATASADEPGLSLTDLAAYRAALEPRDPPDRPAAPVTFRDLWDRGDQFRGRRVRVEGRVVRRFRQGALGTFPPLAETWAASSSGDLLCLVSPDPSGGDTPGPSPGALVRFEGTFLRRVRYRGGDADRLAPLVVGPRPPAVVAPAPSRAAPGTADTGDVWWEWALGLLAGAFVALALARQHLRKPLRRPSREDFGRDPPPLFVDGP